MKLLLFAGLLLGLAAPATPQNAPPKLVFPVDCILGESCWIARYMDRAPGQAKADYQCKPQTEDKHNGTDIVLADTGVMTAGVTVRAAAAGRVLALRDGMPDVAVTTERARVIQKQGCGNVLVLGHGNGWQTSYCHLKNDSLLVEKGDMVSPGQAVAQVGLSGLTEYPHLHFMVQRTEKGKQVQHRDPFDSGVLEGGCKAANTPEQKPLWIEPIEYAGPVILPPLISDAQITRQMMWQAQSETLSANSLKFFIQARGFHTLPGDIWRFSLFAPDGTLQFTHDVKQTRQRQLVEANANFERPGGGFLAGRWTATVELVRGGISMGKQMTSVIVE